MNAQQKDRALLQRIYNTSKGSPGHGRIIDNFGTDHSRTLRRAQMTLHRWAEEMCNGTIQREGDDGEGKPFRVYPDPVLIRGKVYYRESVRPNIPDRERGALARVEKVCKEAGLYYYHQTDPRGCALYVGTEPLTASNYYTKGIPCL